jgi:hypothetical protein
MDESFLEVRESGGEGYKVLSEQQQSIQEIAKQFADSSIDARSF